MIKNWRFFFLNEKLIIKYVIRVSYSSFLPARSEYTKQ